ncbi:MAG: hypothetical protein IPI46_01790 [Bacteroidetes bacterium]|nr:hypothetical protein [Bacteroidota bacterium]
MKKGFLLLMVMVVSYCSKAQSPIMVCDSSGNICTPYYNLDTAYTAASPGNYIYIPGGMFALNVTIDKAVHIIGAGYYMDSAMITNSTTITGNILVGGNASNTSIEGLYIAGSISGPTSTNLTNMSFKYCNVYSLSGYLSYSIIKDCIIRYNNYTANNFYNGTYNTITNTFLYDLTNLHNSIIENCNGLIYGNNLTFNTFKNNIFISYPYSPLAQTGGSNLLSNNLYVNSCPYYCMGATYNTNLITATSSSLFASGVVSYSDMHLLPSSVAMTAGENGTQLGVYGGLFPFKEGGVPSNPHIYFKNISPSTNASGQLPVQIKVRAEDH